MPPPSGQPMEVAKERKRGGFRAVYAELIEQGFGADRSILAPTPAPDPLDVPMPGQQVAMPSDVAVVPKASPPALAVPVEAPQQASEWQESATARRRRNKQRKQAERTEVYRKAKDFEPANREVEPSRLQWELAIYIAGSKCLPKFEDQAMKILQVT